MWWRTSNCSPLLIYRPREDERLSWPGWLTYSGRLTHLSGHPSTTGRTQDGERTLARDWRSTAVLFCTMLFGITYYNVSNDTIKSCEIMQHKQKHRNKVYLWLKAILQSNNIIYKSVLARIGVFCSRTFSRHLYIFNFIRRIRRCNQNTMKQKERKNT